MSTARSLLTFVCFGFPAAFAQGNNYSAMLNPFHGDRNGMPLQCQFSVPHIVFENNMEVPVEIASSHISMSTMTPGQWQPGVPHSIVVPARKEEKLTLPPDYVVKMGGYRTPGGAWQPILLGTQTIMYLEFKQCRQGGKSSKELSNEWPAYRVTIRKDGSYKVAPREK